MKRLICLIALLSGMAFAQADGPGGATNGTVPNKCGRGSNPCTVANALTVSGLATLSGGALVGAGTPNEGTTGTDLNGTAEFVNVAGVGYLKACATTSRYCFLVVKETSCAGGTGCTTGNAYVNGAFTEAMTFSNTSVVGNWTVQSTANAKQVMDSGVPNTQPCPSTCLGFALTAGTSSQTVVVLSPIQGTAVVVTTSTPITVSSLYTSAYYFNQHATPATAIAYTLPTAAAGLQFCFGNSYNGSAADTGVLTVNTSASGQYIIDVDGTLGATGGHVTSGGAGGDKACLVGVDATHWQLYVNKGVWTKN